MIKMRKIFSIVLAALLTGCVSGGINKKYIQNTNDSQPTGTVVFTYAEYGDWRKMVQPEVHFQSIDGNITGSVGYPNVMGRYLLTNELLPIPVPSDLYVTPNNPIGGSHAIELPEGEYEFIRISSPRLTPLTYRSGSNRQFAAKFTVKPETVTYIGRLTFEYSSSDSMVGLKILDKYNEDASVIRGSFKSLSEKRVESGVPLLR